ncbi:uncharacterized protein LOC111534762, partial [Piliocolobus tephrosceles]|uniref:uncharacterized protein LOC111534762 n=1 Tax=Piliocolobus tephrosceles TaxID=591936 RepID=UPI000E6AF1EE
AVGFRGNGWTLASLPLAATLGLGHRSCGWNRCPTTLRGSPCSESYRVATEEGLGSSCPWLGWALAPVLQAPLTFCEPRFLKVTFGAGRSGYQPSWLFYLDFAFMKAGEGGLAAGRRTCQAGPLPPEDPRVVTRAFSSILTLHSAARLWDLRPAGAQLLLPLPLPPEPPTLFPPFLSPSSLPLQPSPPSTLQLWGLCVTPPQPEGTWLSDSHL